MIALIVAGLVAACTSTSKGGEEPQAGQTVVDNGSIGGGADIRPTTVPERIEIVGEQGRVDVLVHAKTAFDEWTRPTDDATWQTMRETFDAMIVYSPYFDRRLEFFEDAYVYIDLYALKVNNRNETIAEDNPDFVLQTADGDPVYIPWGCSIDGGCPQFAADVGSPEYQQNFLDRVGALVTSGYRSLLIDDVNLAWRFSDDTGERVTPVDPRTGDDLELEQWQADVAQLLERVRSDYPELSIMHNSIWFADSPDFDNPRVERQIAAADVIMLERGATDRGLTGGSGRFSYQAFLRYIDRVHDLGGNILLLDETATTEAEQEFNLATGLLVNDGDDLVSTEDYSLMEPGGLWNGFGVDLGAAIGPYSVDDGVFRRDFVDGVVIVNEPDNGARRIELDGEFTTLTGETVDEVVVDERGAAILIRS